MKEIEYKITQNEFERLSKLADNVYSITVIVDYYVENHPDEDELHNLAPIIKNLRHNADLLNVFFIDYKNERIL